MKRLLLDENISAALVRLLADLGVYSQSVPHVGLAGRTDHVLWQYALDHDFAVVTTNARDFISRRSPATDHAQPNGLASKNQSQNFRRSSLSFAQPTHLGPGCHHHYGNRQPIWPVPRPLRGGTVDQAGLLQAKETGKRSGIHHPCT